MVQNFGPKAPHHRSAIAIGALAAALALVFPVGAGAAVTVPHPVKPPEVTVPTPVPSGAPESPSPSTDSPSPSAPAPAGGGDSAAPAASPAESDAGGDRSDELGYVDPVRQRAVAQQELLVAKEFANALTGAPTPMLDEGSSDPLFDALTNLGQTIRDAIGGSDDSGEGNVVTDLIAKAWALLGGTTACPKEETPEGDVPICPN